MDETTIEELKAIREKCDRVEEMTPFEIAILLHKYGIMTLDEARYLIGLSIH